MSKNIFYIGDMHFGHKNVTQQGNGFDMRPFQTLDEMHETMISNWNSRVTNADTVIVCGDTLWREDEHHISLFSRLKGKEIVCIRGNHEKLKDQRYIKMFSEICDMKYVNDTLDGKSIRVLCSHFPYAFWAKNNSKTDDGRDRKHDIHIFSHLHNSEEYTLYQKFIKSLEDSGKYCKAYNVGCMLPYMNYTPRTLEEIVEGNK